ncbi:MAG: GGDEF domain-containing protein [Candidatus Dormiibacterota bacterium]
MVIPARALSDEDLAVFESEDAAALTLPGAAGAGEYSLDALPDRRAFEEEAARHVAFARRNGHPLCFALIAFEGFVEPKAGAGHSQENSVLQAATARWRDVLRAEDLLGRWGFGEFGIVLPNCNTDSAVQLCWRLREETPSGHSFSAGLVSYQGTETLDDLVARAGDCLDQAIAKGSDRTVAEGLVDLD